MRQSQRRIKLRQTLARAIITAILITWPTSCTTSRINSAPKVTPPDPYNEAGELVIKYIPAGETITADGDAVLLPYWYWEKVFDYIIDTQAAQSMTDRKTAQE
jgi:hypothetical protein